MLERPQYLKAVTIGKAHIEQDEIEELLFRLLQSFFSRGGRCRPVALKLQNLLQALADLLFVVNDEDSAFT